MPFISVSPCIRGFRVAASNESYVPKISGFGDIVQAICGRNHIIVKYELRVDTAKNSRPQWRAVAEFKVERAIVDWFHNSPCGYRAQYFHSVKKGEAANSHCAVALAKTALETIELCQTRTAIQPSFDSDAAKVWIHQGRWIRRAKWEGTLRPWWDRMNDSSKDGQTPSLHLARQLLRTLVADKDSCCEQKKKALKLIRWGLQAPQDESRIVLKGGWIPGDHPKELSRFGIRTKTLTCADHPEKCPEICGRSWRIHNLGFT